MTLSDEQQHAMTVIVGLDDDPESILRELAGGVAPSRVADLTGRLMRHARREAWRARAEVEAEVGPEIVAELIELDLIVSWKADALGRPLQPGAQLTLTPWGQHVLGVHLDERIVLLDGDDPKEPDEQIVEVAYWTTADPMHRAQGSRKAKPIRLPARRGVYGDRFLEAVVDPRPGPAMEAEWLIDGTSGEPVVIQGRSVKVDRRMRKGAA